jgi:hypothetical protein
VKKLTSNAYILMYIKDIYVHAYISLNRHIRTYAYIYAYILYIYIFVRPNNLSLVFCHLSLYISVLLLGDLLLFLKKHSATLRQKALLYKSSRKHTICMHWKF